MGWGAVREINVAEIARFGHLLIISMLAEIEAAAESLSPQDQQELLLFLATRLPAAGGVWSQPRNSPRSRRD